MKKLLSLFLTLAICLSLCACGVSTPEETTTAKVEDDGILKILLIGHSLGNDSSFMFPDVAKSEGMENLVMGVLYHSGCRVVQHLEFAADNAAQYAYYEYDISQQDEWYRADCNGNFTTYAAGAANDKYIEDGSIAQTLQFGIQRHDWDMVILQGGTGESANRRDSWYTSHGKALDLPGYVQQLMDYVNSQDIEPATPFRFSWNMVWSSPKDPSVRSDDTNAMLDRDYEGSEYVYYKAMSSTLQEILLPNFDFEYVFPAGTTMQNLKSTKLASAEIYRDNIHATDLGRLAVAYAWYCTLTGTAIEDCKIPPMNYKVLLDNAARSTGTDLVLSEEYRAILIEAVGNAVKNPYDILPTQFPES